VAIPHSTIDLERTDCCTSFQRIALICPRKNAFLRLAHSRTLALAAFCEQNALYRFHTCRNGKVAVTGNYTLWRTLQGISIPLSLLTAKDIVNDRYSILKTLERAIPSIDMPLVGNYYYTSQYEWFPVSTLSCHQRLTAT